MQEANIDKLFEDWQRFVKEYACMMRQGRVSGMNPNELNAFCAPYVLRVDSAYARLKQAERQMGISG